jgi:ATP-binding cassette subfamily B (MDR/TAP) protein 1
MLIVMGVFPIYAMCILSSFLSQHKGLVTFSYEDATIYASDCILNYKTVKSLGLETHLLENYMEVVERVSKITRKRGHYAGFTFGLGYGLLFYLYALMFWFAATMHRENIVDFKSMNISLFAGLLGTSSILMSGLFAPDIKQGQIAAKNVFKILDYESLIDPSSESGDKDGIRGAITFDDVSFKYPSRDQCSLSNVSFEIPAGSTFAIVGTTGSGKSTIIQLLLRFYDASEGSVKFDGKDIRNFNICHLRNQIAIVGQEPVLFTGSVASNIAYGIEASEEEVRKAAEQAQALPFILNHPDGFSREVGLRGSRLSGGEKQRVAIARAIIRKPKLLILDEATSALDSDTEAKVVDILGGLMQGRTCVVVAHRIKTVSTMNQIAVLSNGELLELGTFNELMEKKGFLYSLAMQR